MQKFSSMEEKFNILEQYNFWTEKNLSVGFVRNLYIRKINQFIGNRLIKVLVGQRRVGKSFLLRQIATTLVQKGTNRKNVFMLNMDISAFDFISSYKELQEIFNLYLQKLKPEGRVYIFIDEIQNIEGWEKFVNSYSQDYRNEYEIFITGSNSKMLSSELATLLSGRYVKFEVFPFSFSEYCGITNQEEIKSSYLNYMKKGGIPELFNLEGEEVERNYVSTLKDTILLRDIMQRNNIKDVKLLEDLFIYLVNNTSNLFSVNNIVNYYKSKGKKVSYDTIALYLSYIQDTFLIHKTDRYNLKEKDILSGVCKYYVNDLAFEHYLFRGIHHGIGYNLENLQYLDLRRSGYEVYVGSLKNREVDFVAIRQDRVIYVQSAYMLIDDTTIEREYSVLEGINDNYEKYVVSLDDIPLRSKGGIQNIPAWQFYKVI